MAADPPEVSTPPVMSPQRHWLGFVASGGIAFAVDAAILEVGVRVFALSPYTDVCSAESSISGRASPVCRCCLHGCFPELQPVCPGVGDDPRAEPSRSTRYGNVGSNDLLIHSNEIWCFSETFWLIAGRNALYGPSGHFRTFGGNPDGNVHPRFSLDTLLSTARCECGRPIEGGPASFWRECPHRGVTRAPGRRFCIRASLRGSKRSCLYEARSVMA
jgi:hypothetical protein